MPSLAMSAFTVLRPLLWRTSWLRRASRRRWSESCRAWWSDPGD